MGETYSTSSYRKAIERAVAKANVDRDKDDQIAVWTPNQLRHNAATLIRKQYGLADVTQVYAEVHREKTLSVIAQIG